MNLMNLRRKHDFYRHDAPDWLRVIFKTPASFDWFCKDNRSELIATGSLVRIGRDYFVESEKLCSEVIALRGIPMEDAA